MSSDIYMPPQFVMDALPKEDPAKSGKGLSTVLIITTIFVFLWFFVGIAAFIMSLLCFGKTGSTAQHIVGFLLALFFGPFYWIYYFSAASYCRGKKGKKFMV